MKKLKSYPINHCLKKNKKLEKAFKQNYGLLRLNEFKEKTSICFTFKLPHEIEKSLYEIGLDIFKNNNTAAKQKVDNIYHLFFSRQYKNIIILSTAIWLVKDSCVQENNTYFITKSGYQSHIRIEMPYTLANGERKAIALTEEEIKQVEKNYFLLYPIMTKPLSDAPPVIHHSERASTIENDKLDRSKESSFIRALLNLQFARRSGHLPVKIDFYMQVLQCVYALEGMKSTKIEKALKNITTNLLKLNKGDENNISNIFAYSTKLQTFEKKQEKTKSF